MQLEAIQETCVAVHLKNATFLPSNAIKSSSQQTLVIQTKTADTTHNRRPAHRNDSVRLQNILKMHTYIRIYDSFEISTGRENIWLIIVKDSKR